MTIVGKHRFVLLFATRVRAHNTQIQTITQAHTSTFLHTHARKHTHEYTHTRTRPPARPPARTSSTHADADTHTDRLSYTHTHSRTHILAPPHVHSNRSLLGVARARGCPAPPGKQDDTQRRMPTRAGSAVQLSRRSKHPEVSDEDDEDDDDEDDDDVVDDDDDQMDEEADGYREHYNPRLADMMTDL